MMIRISYTADEEKSDSYFDPEIANRDFDFNYRNKPNPGQESISITRTLLFVLNFVERSSKFELLIKGGDNKNDIERTSIHYNIIPELVQEFSFIITTLKRMTHDGTEQGFVKEEYKSLLSPYKADFDIYIPQDNANEWYLYNAFSHLNDTIDYLNFALSKKKNVVIT